MAENFRGSKDMQTPDLDERILGVLACGRPVTVDTIAFVLGVPKRQVGRRLLKLRKYPVGICLITVRPCHFWGIDR